MQIETQLQLDLNPTRHSRIKLPEGRSSDPHRRGRRNPRVGVEIHLLVGPSGRSVAVVFRNPRNPALIRTGVFMAWVERIRHFKAVGGT